MAPDTDHLVRALAMRMGDNALILGQRVSAWCGHAPVLEEDIALANVALDLIGQTKFWLGLAADLGAGKSADEVAFLRDARAFRNCLLVEQPNGDYGQTLMRQFLFDAWHYPMQIALKESGDPRIAEIAEKSAKEAAYHRERSTDFVIRLGDGSDESHARMQDAVNALYPFAGELTDPDETDAALAAAGLAPDLNTLRDEVDAYVSRALGEATLTAPDSVVRKGGKAGVHSEEMGFILAEMQWLQRAYPGASW